MAEAPKEPRPDDKPVPQSRVGKFIQSYHTFLSTFVIGGAGLIATSIWQYKQSEIARHQAESQLAIAKTQADNQWRIERAEILSKNLQVLATRGEAAVDQRYGVLLSLTRGDLLDPELGVSYALELGRDNAEYMKSVLASTVDKDYSQLAHAFVPTCEQRFGLARRVELCKSDELAARSDAIAHMVSEEAEAWVVSAATTPDGGVSRLANPLVILRDERVVQKEPTRMAWLFAPCLTTFHQRKQWAELRRFEEFSPGARLVAALVLPGLRSGDLPSNGGGRGSRRAAERREWLSDYVMARSCDDDCRARFVDYMMTQLDEARGDYEGIIKKVLLRPQAESGATFERLHTRLIRCQTELADDVVLRDRVLVPAVNELIDQVKPDPEVLDGIVDLMALVPEPTNLVVLPGWTAALARLQKAFPDKYKRGYVDRRAAAEGERRMPPAAQRKVSFCRAADVEDGIGEPE